MAPIARRTAKCGVGPGRAALAACTALALAAAASPAGATGFAVNYANANIDRWACRLCEFDRGTGQEGALRAGAAHAGDGEMRFGRDNGMRRDGGYLELNADYRLALDSGLLLEFSGRDLGLASRDATLGIRHPGRYGVSVRYQKIPRNLSRDGGSPFIEADGLVLPDSWIRSHSTSGMTDLNAATRPVQLATERGRSSVDAWWRLSPGMVLTGGYLHERKRGVIETFRDAFYRATALPQTIDFRLEAAQAGLHYENSWAVAAVSYRFQRFANGAEQLLWQHPYAGADTPGRSATEPDNEAGTWSFVSRMRIGRVTTLNATLTTGETRQNGTFLDYTSNPALELDGIAASGLDARRETLSGALNLVSRPIRRLRIKFSHALTERREQRPALSLTPVLGDLFVTGGTVAGRYDYDRARTELTLRYAMPRRWRLAAGYRNQETGRTNLEIARNEQHRGWLEASRRLSDAWQVRVRHARAGRDASEFRQNSRNNPLTRRYYQAARRDREWGATLRFDNDGGRLSAGFDLRYLQHGYPQSPLGLQRDSSLGWSIDAAGTLLESVTLSGFYDRQLRKSKTAGSVAHRSQSWIYGSKDRVETIGARLRAIGFLHPDAELSVEYALSDGIGAYATNLEDVRGAFPDLVSRHESVQVRLGYPWRPRLRLLLRYYYERYRAADWALDGIGPAAIRNVLSFGRESPRYGNHLIALSLERKLR